MTAKELRKCLAKVPDDAEICNGMGDPDYPVYNIETNQFYLTDSTYYPHGKLIDVSKSKKDCPHLDKFHLDKAHRLVVRGKKIVNAKNDHENHTICVVFSRWDEYLFAAKLKRHEWLTLCVDDVREEGMKLGVGRQWKVCEFSEFAASPI